MREKGARLEPARGDPVDEKTVVGDYVAHSVPWAAGPRSPDGTPEGFRRPRPGVAHLRTHRSRAVLRQ